MYHYRKHGGLFKLTDDTTGEVAIASPVIAVMFDKRCGTMHKHGAPAMVLEWFKKMTKSFVESGHVDIAEGLVIVQSPAWDLDVLNKCLDITGWPEGMVRYYGLHIDPPVGDVTDEVALKHGHRITKKHDPVKYPPFAHATVQFKAPDQIICWSDDELMSNSAVDQRPSGPIVDDPAESE